MNFKLVITFSFLKCTRHQYFIHANIKYDITSKTFCGYLEIYSKMESFLLPFADVFIVLVASAYSPRQWDSSLPHQEQLPTSA